MTDICLSHAGLKQGLCRFRRGVAFSLMLAVFICLPALCSTTLAHEQLLSKASAVDLKAVYIFNFIRFTDWPDNQKKQMQGRIRLNVLGDFAIHDAIKDISRTGLGKQTGLEVHACSMMDCMEDSAVLFFGQSGRAPFQHTLELFRNRPVLTISDIPGFASQGGMIEISQRGNRLGFIINLKVVKAANLYISAQLLQLADTIGEDQ